MKLVNLTPHDIVVKRNDEQVVIKTSGSVLRLPEEIVAVNHVDVNGVKVPIVDKVLKAPEILPADNNDTLYIVSLPTAFYLKKPNLIAPDDLIRAEGGAVIGCRRFLRIVNPK